MLFETHRGRAPTNSELWRQFHALSRRSKLQGLPTDLLTEANTMLAALDRYFGSKRGLGYALLCDFTADLLIAAGEGAGDMRRAIELVNSAAKVRSAWGRNNTVVSQKTIVQNQLLRVVAKKALGERSAAIEDLSRFLKYNSSRSPELEPLNRQMALMYAAESPGRLFRLVEDALAWGRPYEVQSFLTVKRVFEARMNRWDPADRLALESLKPIYDQLFAEVSMRLSALDRLSFRKNVLHYGLLCSQDDEVRFRAIGRDLNDLATEANFHQWTGQAVQCSGLFLATMGRGALRLQTFEVTGDSRDRIDPEWSYVVKNVGRLTDHERHILRLLGHTNAEIGIKLGQSERRIEKWLTDIYSALGLLEAEKRGKRKRARLAVEEWERSTRSPV